MYVDQRLQARVPQASKPSVDLESGGSSLDPDATRLREVDEALTKLSATVDDLSAAAAGSGVRTHAAVAGRYRDVVSDFRGEYRRQLAALRARRDNELLYADVRGRRGGPAETSATDILLRERGSLLTGGSAVDELLAQAERTREALATQRASVTHAMSRLGCAPSTAGGCTTRSSSASPSPPASACTCITCCQRRPAAEATRAARQGRSATLTISMSSGHRLRFLELARGTGSSACCLALASSAPAPAPALALFVLLLPAGHSARPPAGAVSDERLRQRCCARAAASGGSSEQLQGRTHGGAG
jgi:hypothetical protein